MISIPTYFTPKSQWAYILPDLNSARADALCLKFNLSHDPAFTARWQMTEKGVALYVVSTLEHHELAARMPQELRPFLSPASIHL